MSNNPLDTSERPTCETCVFWEAGADPEINGVCRHDPPTVAFDAYEVHIVTKWPAVWPHQWCGKHHEFKQWLERKQEGR